MLAAEYSLDSLIAIRRKWRKTPTSPPNKAEPTPSQNSQKTSGHYGTRVELGHTVVQQQVSILVTTFVERAVSSDSYVRW